MERWRKYPTISLGRTAAAMVSARLYSTKNQLAVLLFNTLFVCFARSSNTADTEQSFAETHLSYLAPLARTGISLCLYAFKYTYFSISTSADGLLWHFLQHGQHSLLLRRRTTAPEHRRPLYALGQLRCRHSRYNHI
jgi:hypothetical protein